MWARPTGPGWPRRTRPRIRCQTAGTSVSVPAPASGTTAHRLYFYSTDTKGNAEAPLMSIDGVLDAALHAGWLAVECQLGEADLDHVGYAFGLLGLARVT